MRRGVSFLIGLTLLSGVSAGEAENLPPARVLQIRAGFGTGNSFQQMSAEERIGYAAGFIDGLLCNPEDTKTFEKFLKGKTNVQLGAILEKHIAQNPEAWDQSLNSLAYQAFFLAAFNSSDKSRPTKK